MGVTAGILIATAVASTAAEMSSQAQAEHAQQAALNTQEEQSKLSYLGKSNARLTQMQHVLSQQEAIETTRGVSLGSASFNAIQRDTFNVGSHSLVNAKIQQKLTTEGIQDKKNAVRSQLYGQLFSDAANTAHNIYSDT